MGTATITSSASTTPGSGRRGTRIPLDSGPLRQVRAWRAAGYLAGHLAGGGIRGLAAGLAACAGALAGITVAGLPLLRASAVVVRRCADGERRRLRLAGGGLAGGGLVPGGLVPGGEARAGHPASQDVPARGIGLWSGAATWRELGYLAGLWPLLALLDVAVLSVWGSLLIGITLPLWYWAPRGTDVAGYVRLSPGHGTTVHGVALGYFPHGPAGPGGIGLYADTLPKALLAAVIFAGLFLAFGYVVVQAARAQAGAARAILGDVAAAESR